MKFADRLKELRKEKNITQAQLAATLGVSTASVAMWEAGKRQPNFETVNDMSDFFDRRIDYILGYSDDKTSPVLTDEEIEELGKWETENHFSDTFMSYLRLDDYGKNAVESLIRAETQRCLEQESLFPERNFSISIRIRKN